MTPDRHLGAARIDRLRPDLLITETTYATTIRDSKRARERDFLTQVLPNPHPSPRGTPLLCRGPIPGPRCRSMKP